MTTRFMQNLKLVQLDSPVNQWDNPDTQYFFNQLISLKLSGYGAKYPKGVLSVDVGDFIANHLLICLKTNSGLKVISGYKTISVETCIKHRVNFPLTALLQTSNANIYLPKVDALFQEAKMANNKVNLDYSFTISPEVAIDKEYTKFLKDIIRTMHNFYHQENETFYNLTCGVVRFKVDKMFDSWGYQSFKNENGDELPLIPQFSLYDELVKLYYMQEHSPESKKITENYKSLWDQRLIITSAIPKDQKIAA